MKVALYARVSTNRQETDNQLLVLRQWAASAGHEVVYEFVDDGISGKTAKRPAFQQMLEAARRLEFQLLCFWSLDRLSREGALETMLHLRRLNDYGVAWRSHTEEYISSLGPFADVIVSLMGTIAKLERIKLSERTKAGLARVKASGRPIGRQKNDKAYTAARQAKVDFPEASVRKLARIAGCSAATVLRALAEDQG